MNNMAPGFDEEGGCVLEEHFPRFLLNPFEAIRPDDPRYETAYTHEQIMAMKDKPDPRVPEVRSGEDEPASRKAGLFHTRKKVEKMPRLVPDEFLRAARDAAHSSASPQEAEAKINLAYRSMVRSLHQGEMHKRVVVVNGAPGSGKTHFVKQHIQPKDIALDLDYITAALALDDKLYGERLPQLDVALALRETVFTEVEARRGEWETAYIITAEKDRQKVQALVARLDAELVTIDTTPEQCKANIQSDARREGYTERYLTLVDEWYENRD